MVRCKCGDTELRERNSGSREHWRESWNGAVESGGMTILFIEEGRQTSFIGGSVSPERCHRGQHQINHLRPTHSVVFFSFLLSFMSLLEFFLDFLFFLTLPSNLTCERITSNEHRSSWLRQTVYT